MATQTAHDGFLTTRWTLLDELRAESPGRRRAALERLSTLYWPAVYAYLRHAGLGRDAAEEATQAFFVDVVVGRRLLETATPERGRLRTLILTALKRYKVDQHRRRKARGDGQILALDDGAVQRLEATISGACAEPSEAFDRRWAAAQVDEALRRCRQRFERTKATHWQAFEDRVVGPTVRMTTPTPLAELAERLGFRTGADAAAAVQVVKKRFEMTLREVIAETSEDSAEEYRYLVGMLG